VGVLTYTWLFVYGNASLVVIVPLYGASSGALAGLLLAPRMRPSDTSNVRRRTGMFVTIPDSSALAGPPISGAINHTT
ncbi:hypothetical protein BJY52DRAFT_1088420, partial [Lactarius psammicola]